MPKCSQCLEMPLYPFTANIQEDTSDAGERLEEFTATVTGMPVNVTPISGQASWRGRQLESVADYVVETPYRSGVDPRKRIALAGGIYNGINLNIKFIHPVHKPGMMPVLELFCTELQ